MELIATCAFGLEKLVRDELRNLGLWTTEVEDGRVTFSVNGKEKSVSKTDFQTAIIKSNLCLRCADRIQIKMGEFEAINFDKLFDEITALPWGKYIGPNDIFPIQATSAKCILHSEPAIQSIVKKAVVTHLQKAHKTELLPENSDAFYQIIIKGNKDKFIVTIDTSGESLHRRGYRTQANDAPMKETLAASIIKLSDWIQDWTHPNNDAPTRSLIDTFTGSGTIPIEAALIAKNRAPGLNRSFAFEGWPWISKEKITEIKSELKKAEIKTNANKESQNQFPLIFAFDIDPNTIEIAKQNARQAGVEDMIIFKCSDFNAIDFTHFENATFVTNPPYGERLEEEVAVTKMYRQFGEKFHQTKGCSLFLITSREDFPRLFGRAATKNRKLFNGNLKCYLYSYLC